MLEIKSCNFRSFRNSRWAFLATPWINFVHFVGGTDNYRKFPSFRKFRNFRSFRKFRWGFLATPWINFVNFVGGSDNYRKFRNFRKFCNFRSFRNSRWPSLLPLWINFVDFVNGLDNYRKFRSFRNCVQSWTLLRRKADISRSSCSVPLQRRRIILGLCALFSPENPACLVSKFSERSRLSWPAVFLYSRLKLSLQSLCIAVSSL